MLAAPTEVRACDPDAWRKPDRTGGNDPAGFRHGRGCVPGYRPADRRHGAGGLPGAHQPAGPWAGRIPVQPTRQTRPGHSMRTCCRRSGYRLVSFTAGRMPCSSIRWTPPFGRRSTAGSKKSSTLDAIAGAGGLLTGSNLGNHNVTAVTTFALYLSQSLFSASDGRYAGMKSDIRVLMGSPTYGHAGGVYQSSAYKSALSALEQESGGVRVSAHVPAVASHRQNAVVTARDASGHGATGLGRGHDHRGRSDPER